MNEKQKRLLEEMCSVRQSRITGDEGNIAFTLTVDYDRITALALELLADEPEKSLRDYTLAELAELVHDMAKEKGWWDAPREWPEIACLIHSEISEAVECYRRGEMAMHVVDGKPEGLVVELADVLIRCLDYLATLTGPPDAWQMSTVSHAINSLYPMEDRQMLEHLCMAHMCLNDFGGLIIYRIGSCVRRIFYIARQFGLDLPAAIEAKIHYNATRPYRHGGKKA